MKLTSEELEEKLITHNISKVGEHNGEIITITASKMITTVNQVQYDYFSTSSPNVKKKISRIEFLRIYNNML